MNQIPYFYYQNNTSRDIYVQQLGLTIKKGSCISLMHYKKGLRFDKVVNCMESGELRILESAGLVSRLDEPPAKKQVEIPEMAISKVPIYSKDISVFKVDPGDAGFVESLSKEFYDNTLREDSRQVKMTEEFLKKVDLDGFSDPLEDIV